MVKVSIVNISNGTLPLKDGSYLKRAEKVDDIEVSESYCTYLRSLHDEGKIVLAIEVPPTIPAQALTQEPLQIEAPKKRRKK